MINLLPCLILMSSSFPQASPSWKISDQGGLIRNGSLYNPVGLAIDGDAASIGKVESLGVKNFCVSLPLVGADWKSTFTELQKSHSQFLVKVSSAAAPSTGYDIDPLGYRISNVTQPVTLDLNLPGTQSALLIFGTSRDSELEWHKVVNTPNGLLHIELNPLNDLNHVLLIYPLQQSMQLPDLWGGMNQSRDHLLNQLFSIKNTQGLVGIVDPFGDCPAGIPPNGHFVPTDKLFQSQFAEYLQKFYRDVKFVPAAWGMDITTFSTWSDYARLVPLWEGGSGAKDLYDPKTGSLYPVDTDHSLIWRDINTAINQMAQQRFKNISQTLHSILDVPVIQTWNGWGVPYEGEAVVDGVSAVIQGNQNSEITEAAAKAQSSLSRWGHPGWLAATSLKIDSTKGADISSAIQDLVSLNVQAAYLNPQSDEQLTLFAKFCASQNMGTPSRISAVFYPDSVENPAFPQQIGGGRWWLPAPITGARLNLGSELYGYRMIDNIGPAEVIWGRQPDPNELLLFANPKVVTIESQANDFPSAKLEKDGIRLSIGTLPIVIRGTTETPAPASAVAEIAKRFAEFKKLPNFTHADTDALNYAYNEAATSLPRSPGPAFDKMQLTLNALQSRLGSYYFLSGGEPSDQNFGRREADPSSIGGRVWHIKSLLPQPAAAIEIQYEFSYLFSNPDHLWIAISGSDEDVAQVSLNYNGGLMHAKLPGILPFGYGYRWYDFGPFQMATGHPRFALDIDGKNPVDLKIDAILVAPEGIIPRGPSSFIRQQK